MLTVYEKDNCQSCLFTKRTLSKHGVDYEVKPITEETGTRRRIVGRPPSLCRTVTGAKMVWGQPHTHEGVHRMTTLPPLTLLRNVVCPTRGGPGDTYTPVFTLQDGGVIHGGSRGSASGCGNTSTLWWILLSWSTLSCSTARLIPRPSLWRA